MDLRTISAFVEVVRAGGFSRAAETVHATQSALSKAVRQLEDEVGMPLLDRIGHRIRLTPAGEVMFARGQTLLAARDDLATEMHEIAGLRAGVLRLGLPPIGSSSLFAPLFARYRRLYPRIEIRLSEHGSDRLEELLRAGEIDFAGLLLPAPEEFEACPVRAEPLVALIAVDNPLAQRDGLSLADLAEEPLVLFDRGFTLNRIIGDGFHRLGRSPMVVANSSQIDFIVELAAAGLGIAFLPQMIAERHAQPAVAQVLLTDAEMVWRMAMVWRRGAYQSHAARAWLALVEAAFPGESPR